MITVHCTGVDLQRGVTALDPTMERAYAEHGSRLAGERLLEPNVFNKRCVLDQPEQCCFGIDQFPARLLLRETVKKCVDRQTMFLKEDQNLLVDRQSIHLAAVSAAQHHSRILAHIATVTASSSPASSADRELGARSPARVHGAALGVSLTEIGAVVAGAHAEVGLECGAERERTLIADE